MSPSFDLVEFEEDLSLGPDGGDDTHADGCGASDGFGLPDVEHAWFWESPSTHEELVRLYGDPFVIVIDRGVNKISDINLHYWAGRCRSEMLILFEPNSNQFFEYVAVCGLWRWVTDATVCNRLAEYLLTYSRRLDLPLLEKGRTAKRLEFMLNLLRADAERREPFTKFKGMVHLKNGMLDLNVEPPVLREFSPHYFSLCQNPVAFDSAAVCPRFFNELLYRALDPEDVELLRLISGLYLLRWNALQVVLLMVGLGGAGKGTIERVIAGVIGRSNIKQLRTKHLDGRFELDNLDQVSLLVGSDVSGEFLSQAGSKVIKALTGGDPLTVETKGGRKRDIWGEHNILITCNDRLRVKLDGDQSAWKRRLVVIEFSKAPPKIPIPDFDQILLREEAAGILNWMILGAVDVMKIVRNGGRLPTSEGQSRRVEDL